MKSLWILLMLALAVPFAGAQTPAQDDAPEGRTPRSGRAEQRQKRFENAQNEQGNQDETQKRRRERRDMMIQKEEHQRICQLVDSARSGSEEAKIELKKRIGEQFDRNLKAAERILAENERMIERQRTILEKRKTDRDAHVEQLFQRMMSDERPEMPERFEGATPHRPGYAQGGRPDFENKPVSDAQCPCPKERSDCAEEP